MFCYATHYSTKIPGLSSRKPGIFTESKEIYGSLGFGILKRREIVCHVRDHNTQYNTLSLACQILTQRLAFKNLKC